jgi:hypothetical protein
MSRHPGTLKTVNNGMQFGQVTSSGNGHSVDHARSAEAEGRLRWDAEPTTELLEGLVHLGTSPTGHAASGCFGPFRNPQNANKSSKSGVAVIEGAIPMHIYRPP